ncbi:hypothetical protein [Terriglobus tenax]|uniref:hypothetical protein n=1 Tax=Terriglobus tenax TaxID=1111115 RepID=UPI0021DF65FE|nr:hypothetical protein [Terriglobus tenax]
MPHLILFVVISVLCGYLAVIGVYLALTFGVTALQPRFVMRKGHFTGAFITLHSLLWAVCGAAGGYVATRLSPGDKPYQIYLPAGILVLAISYIVLTNSGQLSRSRAAQALFAVAGIAGGSLLIAGM